MCDAALPASLGQPEEVGFGGRLVPIRNPAALAGYYLGIFSLIPILGALLGPAALVLGVLGVRAAPKVPGRVGKVHAWIGIVLGVVTSLANWGALILAL